MDAPSKMTARTVIQSNGRPRAPLTQELLKTALHYGPDTGIFTWLIHRKGTARAGSRAGAWKSGGYRHVQVFGVRYEEHRLAWFYMHGVWPNGEIDHIDRRKDNNCIANLRDVSRSENQQNMLMQSNNTSGHRGVSWSKSAKRWVASIVLHQKLTYLGSFVAIEDACAAYKAAAASMHTHNPISEVA